MLFQIAMVTITAFRQLKSQVFTSQSTEIIKCHTVSLVNQLSLLS